MNLYLDDDSAKALLATLLRRAGHQAVTPADAGTAGYADPKHLTYAAQHKIVLLTRNHDDFEDLHVLIHTTGGRHSGILIVRFDNDPSRDMRDRDIVRAISNLEQSGAPIENEFQVLNHWR